MEIKEFGQVIAREVKDALGDCYSIDYSDVLKNNGVVYHAITIRKEDESVAPTIYIDQLYEQFNRGALLMGIVNDVVNMYRYSAPKEPIDMDFFFDFSMVMDKLFFKVVNYKKNREKLKEVPIKRILDLALVPLCHYKNEQMGDGAIMIQNSHLEEWEISKNELWENVSLNAPKEAPPKVTGLMDFLERVTGMAPDTDAFCGVYVVTNQCENLGAGVCFYPGVLKEIADDHECDLYVIPSSIHECLVIPDADLYIDPDNLRQIIGEVNRSTVADEDVLSDNLYKYDRENDRFYIVEE